MQYEIKYEGKTYTCHTGKQNRIKTVRIDNGRRVIFRHFHDVEEELRVVLQITCDICAQEGITEMNMDLCMFMVMQEDAA